MIREKNLSILHLNTNGTKGGAAKVAWRLMSEQRSRGQEANILVGYRDSRSPNVYPFDIDRKSDAHSIIKSKGLLDYDLRGSDKLTQHPLVQQADILHLHNLHGGYFNPFSLIELSTSRPVVWTLHDMYAVTGHCAYSMGCDQWEGGCGNCPDLSLYPSIQVDSTRQLLMDKRKIYDSSQFTVVTPSLWLKKIAERSVLQNHRIELIYNGVDTRLFIPHDKQMVRKKHGLPQDTILIGCVANLFGDARKGSAIFDSIAEYLTAQKLNVKFLKIGQDDPNNRHSAIIHTGYIEDEHKLSELYAAMDVFLFPSMADNCPLVLSEAMACGVPIVSYRTGGIPEIVRHGETGFIADPGNFDSVADYLNLILSDENLRQQMSVRSRIQAEREYDHRKIADRYDALYHETIDDFNKNRNKHGMSAVRHSIKQYASSSPTHSFRFDVLIYSNQTRVLDRLSNTLKEQNIKIRFTSSFEELLRGDTDFIYMADPDCDVDPLLFETLLSNYCGEDFIACELQLVKNSGESFFSVSARNLNRSDVYQIENHGCMLYQTDFFLKNHSILTSCNTINSDRATFLYANAVKMNLAEYLKRKIASFEGQSLYIYGAGTHTKVILEHLDRQKYQLSGIVDKRAENTSRFEGLPLYPVSELTSLPIGGLLISSYSYEYEMYTAASKFVDPAKIVTLYNPKT